ncbi:MAG: FkbM family methyltransferase [Deltaproteobacteria bacterium]
MIFNKKYRKYFLLESKLKNNPRFTDCHVKVDGLDLYIPDSLSAIHMYREIFIDRIYDFNSLGNEPYILDLGSNIGLSVLFFKCLYPNSNITAFEADPNIFKYLKKNLYENGFNDVNLINKAVWYENTTLNFCSDGADGGHISSEGNDKLICVETVDITEHLKDKQVDFLKIDIEGAEEFVIPACQKYLMNVRNLFVEYHSKVGQKQCLSELLKIIEDAGFRVHIHSAVCSPSPFVDLRVNSGFDLQLNIFGWREK